METRWRRVAKGRERAGNGRKGWGGVIMLVHAQT